MTVEDLNTLLDFHYWALGRVLDAADQLTPEQFTRDLHSSFKSVRDTLAHLYSAEWAWHERWHGTSPTAHLSFERFPDVASLRQAWATHEEKMRGFVASLPSDEIARVIEYRALNGSPGSAPIWQMVQHVVNHGSYHRGQLTTMFRQLGVAPAKSMDLIGYYREKSAKVGS
jgi:uncharacterized damage-inducible protein DinB